MAHTAHTDPEDMKENFDSEEIVEQKATQLAKMIQESKHFIIFTGAGVSTSAGIPDFRGPTGVWTLKAQGLVRTGKTTSSLQAIPTDSHMSILQLQKLGICKYLVSQNTDGLHRKSGLDISKFSELHGNTNLEKCEKCKKEYMRDFRTRTAAKTLEHYTGRFCPKPECNGKLYDTIINFGESLPEKPLELGFEHAQKADLCLVLGSSLTVTPAADIPKKVAKGGRLVICNLQRTPLDSRATLKIHTRTDDLMRRVMKKLNIEIPKFVLQRRMAISCAKVSSITDGDMLKMLIEGIDRDSIPASIFTSVDITRKGDKQVFSAKKEPFKFLLPIDSSKLQLTLNFMGNYKEPELQMEIDVTKKSSQTYSMNYDPYTGTWTVKAELESLSTEIDEVEQKVKSIEVD